MSQRNQAVFLSYASQDAEAARRICEALRAAGVEVWFDQSELVGGDAWDAKIRGQIGACALFVPVISANTQARLEGYFRIEWKLAARRTHAMATAKAFLLPVVIDETRDTEAHVPDEFRDVQWTRLLGGETTGAFGARVVALLRGEVGARTSPSASVSMAGETPALPGKRERAWHALVFVGVLAVGALAIWRPWQSAHGPASARGEVIGKSPAPPDTGSTVVPSPAAERLGRVRAILAQTDVVRAELDTAVELADGAIKVDGTNAEAFAVRALVDWRYAVEDLDHSPARLDAMRQHARQAVSLDATDPTARLAQAQAMVLLNDTPTTREAAVKMLEPLAQRPDVNVQVLLALGWIERSSREKALAYLERAARMPGAAGQAHFARAMVHFREREFQAADDAIDQALASQRAAKFLFWKSYLQLVWEGDATAADRTSRELPPDLLAEDFVMAFRYSAQLYRRDYDGALATLRAFPRDFIGSGDGSVTTGYLKGYVLARAGKTAAAEIEWRAALDVVERRLQAAPNERGLLVHKAFLLASLGERPAAEKLWRATRELFGEAPGFWGEHHIRLLLLPDDEALDYLTAEIERPRIAVWALAGNLRLDPYLDRLRPHPRFAALLARAEADPRLSPRAAKAVTLPSPGAVPKSVAVLAFENLSDDKTNEYFSDGISEELLDAIGKVPGLRVAGRTSSFSFKGKNVPEAEIARQLGVTHIVSGSVQKVGPEIHIRARLVNGSDGLQLWSDKFTRDAKDVIALQDEIAGLIARTLKLKLGAPRVARSMNPEAHSLVLEGRHFWNLRGADPENLARAERALLGALKIDPAFPQALAGLADVYVIRAWWAQMEGQSSAAAQDNARARQRATEALSLDDSLPEPHAALGTVHFLEGAFAEAERAFARAFQNNPSHAVARHWHSVVQGMQGRLDLALEHSRDSALADPRSPNTLWSLATIYNYARRHEEALTAVDRSLALRPGFLPALAERAVACWFVGRKEEAVTAARMIARDRTSTIRWWADPVAIFVLRLAGHEAEAEEAARHTRATAAPDDYRRGFALAALGRMEEAYAVTAQVPTTAWGCVFYHRLWDQGRDDPGFLRMVERLGCAEKYKAARASIEKLAGTAKK